MNDNWYIPRAAIMPTSSSLSNSMNTSSTILATELALKHKQLQEDSATTTTSEKLHENLPLEYHNNYRCYFNNSNNNNNNIKMNHQQQQCNKQNRKIQILNQDNNTNNFKAASDSINPDSVVPMKRGPKLSQSSNCDSNNTSFTSDCLLLTAANLERFTAVQHKNDQSTKYLQSQSYLDYHQLPCLNMNMNIRNSEPFHKNLWQMPLNFYDNERLTTTATAGTTGTMPQQTIMKHQPYIHFIDIERNLNVMKTTKDLDAVSVASSMHFTMINGETGRNNKDKHKSLCDRGHQLTVLITCMSILFLILILSMVYALEMRARDMLQS